MKKSTLNFEIFFNCEHLGEEQMYLGMEPAKKTVKEDWVKYMDHDAIKLLLGDEPKDKGNNDPKVMDLQGKRIDVSKFVVEAKEELKNWTYEEAPHQKGEFSKIFESITDATPVDGL